MCFFWSPLFTRIAIHEKTKAQTCNRSSKYQIIPPFPPYPVLALFTVFWSMWLRWCEMTLSWQLSDYLLVSMFRRVCWVMLAGRLLFSRRREQLGWSVSLCWWEKGSLIMILGRVWVNHLTSPYSSFPLKHTCTHKHLSMYCFSFITYDIK